MARTTIDIDTPLLKELKRLQKIENKSLGRLVSDLLSEALARHAAEVSEPGSFEWVSEDMGALVDIADKDALYAALDDASE